VTIGVVGKYVHLTDSYKSLNEALIHGGLPHRIRVAPEYIDSEEIEKYGPAKLLSDVDAILIPGGFGARGIEGKIQAAQWAREKMVPFFGICLGMQVAVIEFARNVCQLHDASSGEFQKEGTLVIDLMTQQQGVEVKGGTMRLGAYRCVLHDGTRIRRVYKVQEISERHRHRYEVNNKYRKTLEDHGLVVSGVYPDLDLVEIVELPDHPWYLGCQFHPEFKSRVFHPHPIFVDFIRASSEYALKKRQRRKVVVKEKRLQAQL